MKKHDFGAWFLLCGLLFLFTPGVSAMAEEPKPLFAFAAQEEEVRPGGSFAVTCTPARGDIGAFVLFADFDAEVIANAKVELPESVKSRHVYTSQQDGRFALVYAAKDGGALTEPFTLVFRTERGAEFDAVTVSFSVTDAANAVGHELIDTVQTTEKTFTYVKEPEIGAALLSLIPPTGTLSPSFDPEMFQYSLSVPFSVTSLVFDAQPAEGCAVRVNRENLGAGDSTVDFEFTVTSESGETAVYTVAVTRETKPVTAVAGKTGTSSAAKGKDAASSEKSAENETAEANVEEAPAETTVVTGEARDADLTRRKRRKTPVRYRQTVLLRPPSCCLRWRLALCSPFCGSVFPKRRGKSPVRATAHDAHAALRFHTMNCELVLQV